MKKLKEILGLISAEENKHFKKSSVNFFLLKTSFNF